MAATSRMTEAASGASAPALCGRNYGQLLHVISSTACNMCNSLIAHQATAYFDG
jgi:hypothetical protein